MTKQELLETYTAEQLAEMVIEIQNELNVARNLQNEVLFEERIAENIRKTTGMNIDDVRKILQDTKKYMNDKYVKELQSEVEKYRKAFEGEKKERDCQIAEYQKKIKELEHDLKTAGEKIQDLAGENMKLQCERNDYKTKSEFLEVERMRVKKNEIADFLPTEPIKIADMVINELEKKKMNEAKDKRVKNENKGIFCLHEFNEKQKRANSELRQIAEHLLVYCNHNGGVEK